MTGTCTVCARVGDLRFRWFVVLGYKLTDWICRECLEMDTDEGADTWEAN